MPSVKFILQLQGQGLPSASSLKSMQYSSAGPSGRGLIANRNSSGAPVTVEPAKKAPYDPLIGRKVMTRWPADNHFYEAIITDYNPVEISPEDIRWEGEDPDINYQPGQGAPGRKIKKSTGRGDAIPGAGRGRGTIKNQPKKDFPTSQNGVSKKNTGDIEILHTETLIKEEHEQSLIDAIARLADASDGEREDDEHQFPHEQYMERDGEWRNEQYGGKQHRANHHEDDMITGEGGEDSDGHHLIGDAVASGYQHHGDNDDT
ncbi:hypothetical protein BHE74_00028372 [Ensete ventricosum]|nr:hypothetical protein BHE74_00028372 [Ensete ventricosum]RZS03696.1 hypothetical protein BHM03_00033907 [Ensete ventricosum]